MHIKARYYHTHQYQKSQLMLAHSSNFYSFLSQEYHNNISDIIEISTFGEISDLNIFQDF